MSSQKNHFYKYKTKITFFKIYNKQTFLPKTSELAPMGGSANCTIKFCRTSLYSFM